MADLVIIGREQWGARHRAGFGARALPTAEAWLHHTVTQSPDLAFRDLNADSLDDDEVEAMRTLERIGQQRFGGGVSYNLVVMPSGRVYEGCGIDRVGAHTGGRNTRALGVALAGDYSRQVPPQEQQDALVALLQTGARLRWISAPRFTGGHRDVSKTSCPGAKAYALIQDLNARASGAPVTAPHQPAPTPVQPNGDDDMDKIVARWGYLKRGSSGQGVLLWQGLLNGMGRKVTLDGDYGPGTEAATKEWQAAAQVPGGADGIVGANTWGRALGVR